VREIGFLKRFQVPNNIVKYDSKTNPNVWLEGYQLACGVTMIRRLRTPMKNTSLSLSTTSSARRGSLPITLESSSR
jgi:hypothetical protein